MRMVVVGHVPAIVDLAVYAGDDFAFAIDVQDADGGPVDLTGSTGLAQIRATPDAVDVLATFVTEVVGSTVTLRLPGADTAALADYAVWDVQVTRPDDVVITLAAGQVAVGADVTRAAAPPA